MDLEDHFTRAFSVTALLADPTARAVAAQFAPIESTPIDDTTVDAGVDSDAGRSGAVCSSLVEWIRSGADDQPVLVLLAPGSGHLLGYEPLIRSLDPTTPILGVRLPGYDGKAEPVESITELASIVSPLLDAALTQRVEAVGDRGAVLLGGSSGGLLAWELQHRAEIDGRPFAGVVMQDTVHPDWRREQASMGLLDELRQLNEAGGARSVLTELYGRGERKLMRWQRARRSRAQAATTGAELPAVIAQRMFAATIEGLVAYEVPNLTTGVLFVAAANTDPDATFDRWNACTAELRVEIFDGDHFGDNGITAARNVGPVAVTIDALLRTLKAHP
jgi:thioesterase domain-containing protein